MAESLIYLSFYSSESCHLSEYTLELFNLGKFYCLSNKFEVWAPCAALCDAFVI